MHRGGVRPAHSSGGCGNGAIVNRRPQNALQRTLFMAKSLHARAPTVLAGQHNQRDDQRRSSAQYEEKQRSHVWAPIAELSENPPTGAL
jgi:hypothetical protein